MSETDELRMRVEVLERLLPALVGRALRRSGLKAAEFEPLIETLLDDHFKPVDDRAMAMRDRAQALLVQLGFGAVRSDLEHPPSS